MNILFLLLLLVTPVFGGMTVTIIEEDGETSSGGAVSCSDVESTGLSAYWKFEEGAGASVNDEASTHDLSLANTPTWTTGQCSGGLSFASASTEYGDAASPPIIGDDDTFSICAWVKHGMAASWGTIYAEGSDASDNPLIQFAVNGTTVGDITFAIRDDSAGQSVDYSSGDVGLDDDNWHHVCIVQTAGNARQLYVDGSASGGGDTTNVGNARTVTDSNVGVLDRTSNGDYMDGEVDNIRVYADAITSTQVSNIYNDEN